MSADWSLETSVAVLLAAAVVLVVAGVRFTRIVDRLADRTGIGEALAGGVLLGATTSLPGLIVTTVSAARGAADLALSNALGGIAAQTTFLAVADLLYPRANLEHAAASLPNLLQTMILVALIATVLLAATGPAGLDVAGIHPATLLLPAGYAYGLVLVRRTHARPMWRARATAETRADVPDRKAMREPLLRLWLEFGLLGAVVAGCGFAVARAGLSLSERTGLSETIVGGFVTSIVTSLPELVTVIAAVRTGALTLAVGDIIGGNTFDVLFVPVADVAYREGSVYAAVSRQAVFLCALTVLMTAILAAGLTHRQRRGIGFEGTAILVVYGVGFVALSLLG